MSTRFLPDVTLRTFRSTVAAMLIMCVPAALAAGNDMTIKLAQVAPKGSIYHRVLQEAGGA